MKFGGAQGMGPNGGLTSRSSPARPDAEEARIRSSPGRGRPGRIGYAGGPPPAPPPDPSAVRPPDGDEDDGRETSPDAGVGRGRPRDPARAADPGAGGVRGAGRGRRRGPAQRREGLLPRHPAGLLDRPRGGPLGPRGSSPDTAARAPSPPALPSTRGRRRRGLRPRGRCRRLPPLYPRHHAGRADGGPGRAGGRLPPALDRPRGGPPRPADARLPHRTRRPAARRRPAG